MASQMIPIMIMEHCMKKKPQPQLGQFTRLEDDLKDESPFMELYTLMPSCLWFQNLVFQSLGFGTSFSFPIYCQSCLIRLNGRIHSACLPALFERLDPLKLYLLLEQIINTYSARIKDIIIVLCPPPFLSHCYFPI